MPTCLLTHAYTLTPTHDHISPHTSRYHESFQVLLGRHEQGKAIMFDLSLGGAGGVACGGFETEARECFGADWRTGYFYGKVTKKNGQRVWASYDEDDSDDDDTASHFSFLELGVQSGAVASNSITPFATVVGPFL